MVMSSGYIFVFLSILLSILAVFALAGHAVTGAG
jgi:hypothetical protein